MRHSIALAILIYSPWALATSYDPRELQADDHETAVTNTTYYTDAYGKSQSITTITNYHAIQISQGGRALSEETTYSSRKELSPKLETLQGEIRNAIRQNAQMDLAETKDKDKTWLWLNTTSTPAWRENLVNHRGSYDSRGMLISQKDKRLEVWNKGQILFTETHGSASSASEKAVLLKAQLAIACSTQRNVLHNLDSTGKWIWIEPTDEKNFSSDSEQGYTVERSGRKVILKKNGAVVFTESHWTQSSAQEKTELLLDQILKSCREGTSLNWDSSKDGKWVWLHISGKSKLEPSQSSPKAESEQSPEAGRSTSARSGDF